jgi:hypothetical protein
MHPKSGHLAMAVLNRWKKFRYAAPRCRDGPVSYSWKMMSRCGG